MKRDLLQLTNNTYDLLVIGGGIHGACIAWDAALRGLHVCLIERDDFGQAASANSLKTIHGGLRYLQDGNLRLVRRMSRERQTWLRIAPHLVRPLPCLMPTTARLLRSRLALKTALTLNDLLSIDRNRSLNSTHFLPDGRLISSQSCLKLLPGLANTAVTGAAIWYDAQMLNSERLLLSIIQAAAAAGAHVVNYVEAVDFLRHGARLGGIKAVDKLTGTALAVQSRLVINCAGAWVDKLLARLNGRTRPLFPLSTATNIITRQLFPNYAVALPGQAGDIRFIVPWQQYSLIGTLHQPYQDQSDEAGAEATAVQTLIDDINFAYPTAALTHQDVTHVHHGFLPTIANPDTHPAKLLRRSRLHDHEHEDKMPGLITVVGVKYTTARQTAERAVDLALRKLGRPHVKSRTGITAVHGGHFHNFAQYLVQASTQKPFWLSETSLQHLIQNYGTNYLAILAYYAENPAWGETISPTMPVLSAEIIHAIRTEMAQTLGDVIRRRTPLGAAGLPDTSIVQHCATLMTAECGWSAQRRAQEIQTLYATSHQPEKHSLTSFNEDNYHKEERKPLLAAAASL
jgi:glycerol-3-phosphate dehydrogenase